MEHGSDNKSGTWVHEDLMREQRGIAAMLSFLSSDILRHTQSQQLQKVLHIVNINVNTVFHGIVFILLALPSE